jgi:hypothetical protein
MQEQFFLFSGGTGICFQAGLKKSGRGRKFAGEGWAPPGSNTPKVRWGGLSVRPILVMVDEDLELFLTNPTVYMFAGWR